MDTTNYNIVINFITSLIKEEKNQINPKFKNEVMLRKLVVMTKHFSTFDCSVVIENSIKFLQNEFGKETLTKEDILIILSKQKKYTVCGVSDFYSYYDWSFLVPYYLLGTV